MSIDPASIPEFGGRPEGGQPSDGPSDESPGGGVIRPDQDLVKQLLEQMELKYTTDEEGDLMAPWENFRTYFLFRGEDEQALFAVRTFYDRPYQMEDKGKVLEILDSWNRQTLWPKVYTNVQEDGVVRIVGEGQMMLAVGVGLEHFVSSTVTWVRGMIDFDLWFVEQWGLRLDVESGDPGNPDTPDD